MPCKCKQRRVAAQSLKGQQTTPVKKQDKPVDKKENK